MHFTCKCLNVSIKTKGSECNVNIDDIELSTNDRADAFFINDLITTNELETITNEQPDLMEVRNIGAWAIHKCINCMMYTHAVHEKLKRAMVLINSNLITSEEEIMKLKTDPDFSSIFRIIIDHSKADDDFDLEFLESRLPSELRLVIIQLAQKVQSAIELQAILINERIREFIKEQYQILDEFRNRALSEQSLLVRLICNEHQNIHNSPNLETPPATPETIQPNKPTSTNDVDATARLSSKNIVLHQHSSSKTFKNVHSFNGNSDNNTQTRESSSYDGEALFILEGMDDTPSAVRQLQASDQESDTDDSGNEGIHIPRSHRSGHPTLAKSLPVTVPAFHSFGRRSVQDDDDEQISRDPMDPHNIQASIKALAKSVHGDTVFGDLPRPRFSTQI